MRFHTMFLAMLLAAGSIPASANAILLHEYVFNGNVNDQVGAANGTLMGGATASGGVLALNGSSSFVQFASLILPQTGSFSVSLFAQDEMTASAFNGFCCAEFISQGTYGAQDAFYMGVAYRGPSGASIRSGDSWRVHGGPVVAEPTDGLWHDYTMVVDTTGQDSKLFIDGVLRATLGFAISMSATGNTKLGEQYDFDYEPFFGNEANLQIYNGALTAGEVAAIAAEGPTPTTVPEPNVLVLVGTGLAALSRRLRRKDGSPTN